jgi:hypothetical protein
MRVRHTAIGAVALLFSMSIAACGGDSGTEPEVDALTESEVTALMAALESMGALETGGTTAELEVGANSTTQPCPLGGVIEVSGDITDHSAGDTLAFEFDVTVVHQACIVSGNGLTFTLSGSPSLRQVGNVSLVGLFLGNGSLTASLVGALEWTTGARSGVCSINVSMSAEVVEGIEAGSATGTVCGIDYTQDL